MRYCCLCVPPIVARQRLGKHIPAATNTHATIEELLDTILSMRSVFYQALNIHSARKAGE
jgi:hypothetical protein